MVNYGITSLGFNRKDYNTLMEEVEIELKKKDAFGDEIDFTPQDPLYQMSASIMYFISELWQVAENTFYNDSPQFAEGNNLANVAKKIGIAKKQASKAVGQVTFIGIQGTVIPQGFKIATVNFITFTTDAQAVVDVGGTVIVNITALTAGSNANVPMGTINTIVNPFAGITSVNNVTETSKGQDAETDIELRTRYESSTANGNGSTVDSIRGELLKVTGVTGAIVKENVKDITVDDIPPHSIYALVKGGANADVAQSIFATKAGGPNTYGTIMVPILDSQGISHDIKFSRPINKDIWIRATITKGAGYPLDGDTQIKTAIVEYINSLNIDDDVIVYKIINVIAALKILGINDISIQTSTDGINYTSNNVIVVSSENASTDTIKVVIV